MTMGRVGLLALVIGLLPGCPFGVDDDGGGDAGVVVLTGDGDLVAYSTNGATTAWGETVGSGSFGDLLVDGGLIFVAVEGSSVAAMDSADGFEEWSVGIGGTVSGNLALLGDTLFVQTADDVIALDANSGDQLWSRSYSGLSGAMATGDGALGCAGEPTLRLDPSSGSVEEEHDPGQIVPEIAVTDGVVVLGGRYDVIALDASSMVEEWSYPLTDASASGITTALGDIYVSTDNEGIYGFTSGSSSPFMQGLPTVPLDPPAYSDGLVYVTESYGDLFCLDAASGDELWSWETSGDFSGGVQVLGNTVYLADGNALVGLDASSESADWEQSPGGTILDLELL